jgi:hypothetical protein
MTTNNMLWPAALAIAAMWIAVVVVGLWGGDIVTSSGTPGMGDHNSVPVVAIVAPCALLGTIAVARRAFGGPRDQR